MKLGAEDDDFKRRSGAIFLGMLILLFIGTGVKNSKLANAQKNSDDLMVVEYEFVTVEPAKEELKATEEQEPVDQLVMFTQAEQIIPEQMSAAVDEITKKQEKTRDVQMLADTINKALDEGIIESENSMASPEENLAYEYADAINICEIQEMGIQFACDPNWKVIPSEEGIERVIIENKPLITLALNKFDKKFQFLGQLNKPFLENTGLYREDFQTERVKFAGYDAILVKAYSAFNEETQRRDYYYIHNNEAVHISFMLPNTSWNSDTQSKLQDITRTFVNLSEKY